MRKLVIATALSVMMGAMTPIHAQKKKEDQPQVPVYNEGIVYALPATGLRFVVTAEKISYQAGVYQQYAQEFLGISDVRTSDEVSWKIVSIGLETYGTADPEAVFKTSGVLASNISLNADGSIASLNGGLSSSDDEVFFSEFIADKSNSNAPFTDLSQEDFYDIILDSITGGEKVVKKSERTKAREAADALIKLRKRRTYTLIDSYDELPADGKGYETLVKEARRIEKSYISLFVGSEKRSKEKYVIEYVPGSKSVSNEILFRFSEQVGVVAKNDISGKPVVIDVTKDASANKIDGMTSSDNPNAGESGLYYRIPSAAKVSVTHGSSQLLNASLNLGQFGHIAPLSEQMIEDGFAFYFDRKTGAIRGTVRPAEPIIRYIEED